MRSIFNFHRFQGTRSTTWENTEPAFLITDCSVLHQLQKPRLDSWYSKSLHLMLISKLVSTSLPTSFSEASHPLALGTLQVSLDPVKGSLILDFKLKKTCEVPPLSLWHWLLILFHGDQVDDIDVATNQSLHLPNIDIYGNIISKSGTYWSPQSQDVTWLDSTWTCCFPPVKASSKSSLFLDSNLHQPFLKWVFEEMLNRFENLQTFLHKTTATACQLHQQEGCRSALGLPVENDPLANGTYMDYWPLRELLQILEIPEGWDGGRENTTLQSLVQIPGPVIGKGWYYSQEKQ